MHDRLRFTPPPGSCDSHLHFYGPLSQYPVIHGAAYDVPEATPAQFIALQESVGLERAVIVHATATGRDNRRTLDALREFPSRFRGIVTPMPEGVTDAQLKAWDALGVRGMRFSHVGRPAPDMLLDERLASRIAPLGWHAQLHTEGDQIVDLADRVLALACPVVIDHMARIPAAYGVASAAFGALLRLIDSGRVWVKLSAPMRMSSKRYPYDDVHPFATSLVHRAPERVLWASDWPNVNFKGPVPSYRELLDLLYDWAPKAEQRQLILVDNPQTLYRFAD
jgi:2-pyrone-4,6-dicarboxylate lactonase